MNVVRTGSGKSTFIEALAWARPPSQFVIATHSPILMALPGSRILNFDETPIREVAYEDLEHVRLTRDFLNRPERFLRHL